MVVRNFLDKQRGLQQTSRHGYGPILELSETTIKSIEAYRVRDSKTNTDKHNHGDLGTLLRMYH